MTARSRSLLPEPVGRRLTLTPIGLDVVVALAHDPDGIRLSPLAHVIDAPVSSVQAVLRSLTASGLIVRDGRTPPAYALADHPARAALVQLALVLPEPVHVLSVVLRASPAVGYAAVDRHGFIATLHPSAPDDAIARLRATVADITAARANVPPVGLSPAGDLERLAAVSVGSRARLAAAITLKGQPPAAPHRRPTDTPASIVGRR